MSLVGALYTATLQSNNFQLSTTIVVWVWHWGVRWYRANDHFQSPGHWQSALQRWSQCHILLLQDARCLIHFVSATPIISLHFCFICNQSVLIEYDQRKGCHMNYGAHDLTSYTMTDNCHWIYWFVFVILCCELVLLRCNKMHTCICIEAICHNDWQLIYDNTWYISWLVMFSTLSSRTQLNVDTIWYHISYWMKELPRTWTHGYTKMSEQGYYTHN